MNNCGQADLCPITRGDTVTYCFEFVGMNNEPIDLTGMSLHFTMKVKPTQKEPDLHHVMNFWDHSLHLMDPDKYEYMDDMLLQKQSDRVAYIDPHDQKRKFRYDFETGRGFMKIPPEKTIKLKAGQCYYFSFQLCSGPTDIYTIGTGKLPVKPDVGIRV